MIYRNHSSKFVATALMALVILSNATSRAMSAPNPPAPGDKVISIGEARSLPLRRTSGLCSDHRGCNSHLCRVALINSRISQATSCGS